MKAQQENPSSAPIIITRSKDWVEAFFQRRAISEQLKGRISVEASRYSNLLCYVWTEACDLQTVCSLSSAISVTRELESLGAVETPPSQENRPLAVCRPHEVPSSASPWIEQVFPHIGQASVTVCWPGQVALGAHRYCLTPLREEGTYSIAVFTGEFWALQGIVRIKDKAASFPPSISSQHQWKIIELLNRLSNDTRFTGLGLSIA